MLLIASTFTCKVIGLSWFRRLVPSLKISPANRNIRCACGKSFTDDLVASGYCKRESKLCLTIRWGFCRVLRFVLPDLQIICILTAQRFADGIWCSALRCWIWFSAFRCGYPNRVQRFAGENPYQRFAEQLPAGIWFLIENSCSIYFTISNRV